MKPASPIRIDKCKGICRALNWIVFPESDAKTYETISVQEYKTHEAWSPFLENTYGARAAMAFAAGSDILSDHINEDLAELVSMPAGSHLGRLSVSWLCSDLPKQFVMHYDYDFLYRMKCTLQNMRTRAKYGYPMTAHSVMEKLLLYLCNEEASMLIELNDEINRFEDDDTASEEWVFDLLGDSYILSWLYADMYLDAEHPYHFFHWNDQQFYTEQDK